MLGVLRKRWVWITALFAVLNAAGLYVIYAKYTALQERRGELEIEEFTPQDEAAVESAITIRFAEPMVLPEQVGEPVQTELVSIRPKDSDAGEVAGTFEWQDMRTLRFVPDEQWEPATPYVASLSADLTSLLGHSLPEQTVFDFHTPPLRLERAEQTGFSERGRATLALKFTDKVAHDEVKQHLKVLTDKGKPVDFSLSGPSPGRAVMVLTEPVDETSLVVSLARGLRGLSGPLGLAEAVRQAVALNAGLSIRDVEAEADGPGDVSIDVSCSQSVDPEKVKEYVQVDPAVPFSVSTTYRGFRLRGGFEPATLYEVKLLKGLKGTNGTFLGEEVVRSLRIPDYPPSLHLRTDGFYLSAAGNLLLPLECVNVPEAEVSFEKVYENNIVHFLRDYSDYDQPSDLGHTVATKKLTFKGKKNQPREVHINLRHVLGEDCQGVYLATARAKGRWNRTHKLLLVTDLGLHVKRSPTDMVVWVSALSSTKPVDDVVVSVYTRANQRILRGVTDQNGLAHFKDVDWSGDRQPFAVAATKGGDVAFLKLATGGLEDSSLDTNGRAYLRKGYEAYLYTDRGIYRPGETVHLRAIVRGPEMAVPGSFPVRFRVNRPDGRRFTTVAATLSKWGSAEVEVEVPAYAPTGRYACELRVPEGKSALGSASFQLEEFVPDRMKVEVTAEERRFRGGESLAFTVKARHLFGAPAAGRRVNARCRLVASAFEARGFEDHRFADGGRSFATVRENLGTGVLDEKGERTFTLKIPGKLRPPSALRAIFTASVLEVGGRAVTGSVSREVDIYPHYVGIAREGQSSAEVRKEERILCKVVNPDGTLVPTAQLAATVYRIVWHTVRRRRDGRYREVWERKQVAVSHMTCAVAGGRGTLSFTPAQPGEYRVCVRDEAGGASADLTFHCSGHGYVAWGFKKPDGLELVPDKASYAPGETARVLLKAPFAGWALFTVESDRVHLSRVVALKSNTGEFTFPVQSFFAPNVYCTATVIRRAKPKDGLATHRAFGAVPIKLDSALRRLRVDLEAPEQTRPGRPLRVVLHVRGADGKPAAAEVTLAAVDEGICQLTRFQTPDPLGFFYAQRALAVSPADVYSLLMPEVEQLRVGHDSAPGGDETGYKARLLNPVAAERVRPVAIWKSGVVTGEDGRAEILLDVPPFNGELRLMAVAASGGEFGSAARPALVKEPLMIRCSFPRILAPDDELAVPVAVFNNTGHDGTVRLTMAASPGVTFSPNEAKEADVVDGGETTVVFHLRAPSAPGTATLKVVADLDGEQTAKEVEIAVRPPATLTVKSGFGNIRPGDEPHTLAIPGGWVEGTDKYWLSFSARPSVQLGSGLRYLVRYPYGCLEQTTSGSFPLLYLADVAAAADPEHLSLEAAEGFVKAGIQRVLSMQTYNGGFAFWPGYRTVYPWGTVYATHFLVEARKAGYAVPAENLDAALAYLGTRLLSRDGDDQTRPVKAYACFVLAAAGKPNASWTYRLFEAQDKLPGYSRFQLAAALALMKEPKLVERLVGQFAVPELTKRADTGGLLHSDAREAAILLSVCMDLGLEPMDPKVRALVARLESLRDKDGRWASTQENAFVLMAFGKYARRVSTDTTELEAEVTVDGERLASFTHKDQVLLKPEKLGGRDVKVHLKGQGLLYYFWAAEGVPASGKVAEKDNGLKVRRRLLTREGAAVDLDAIPQGEVVVIELAVTNDRPVRNVVISDLLAAGLEIENPRLATRDADEADEQQAFRPIKDADALAPQRVEMRDDRLLLFADLGPARTRRYRYVARAVTRGRFHLPAVSAFCMYRPSIASVHGAGSIQVVEAR